MYANPAAAKVYGLSQEEIVGKTYGELRRDPEQVRFWETYYEIVFATGKTETMEFQYTSPTGKEYYFSTSIVPEFVNGKVTYILTISHDITAIKQAEAKLKETLDNLEELVKERTAELEKAYNSLKYSERSLAEAQKMAHIGNWEWDLVTNELRWSDETYRIFGFKPNEFEMTYNSFLSNVYSDDREYVDNAIKRALKGERYSIEFRIVSADGVERIVHEEGEVAFDEKNTPIRMIGTIQDITERKRTEKALKASETRLRRFYDSGMIGTLYYKMDGSITEANDKFLEMVGYTREDLQTGSIKWDKMTPPEYRSLEEHAIAELKATGVAMPYEKEYIRKDGSRIPIILGVANIDEACDDGIAFVLDITERKKAEEYLAKIEKIRIKEIHHRIKNNLQVISSLLDLQAEKFKDENVRAAFREGQNRVISMSLIHEELYKGEGTDTLDFSAYLQTLAENLFQTYSLNSKNIHLCTYLEESAFFDMDTAVPLGIIVNELISNSLKHAFNESKEGEIRVQFCREEKNNEMYNSIFSLTISDNGIGIPEYLELESVESLGLQLVSILVDQLDGEIELKRRNGTEFTMRFSVTKNA
jgi:PAS domain S-box-containing protein